jgi:hypothetical protein
VGSILKVIFQLVMQGFISKVILFLICIIPFSLQTMAQCPEKANLVEEDLNDLTQREVLVFDSFDSGVDISNFEINIFDKLTGNFVVAESSNFPRIGIKNNIVIVKTGNRIQINNISGELDLTSCIVIFKGVNCPVKKVAITNR